MSTELIIAIVLAAIVLIALAALVLPKSRARARQAKAEREARMAEQVAQRERADANLKAERAQRHEAGLADDELVADHERDRFADVIPPTEDERTNRFASRDRAEQVADEGPPERLRRS